MKGPNCRGIFLLIPPLVIPWEPMEALVDWCLFFQSSHFLRKFPIRNGLSFPIGKGIETKNKWEKDFPPPNPQALPRENGWWRRRIGRGKENAGEKGEVVVDGTVGQDHEKELPKMERGRPSLPCKEGSEYYLLQDHIGHNIGSMHESDTRKRKKSPSTC